LAEAQARYSLAYLYFLENKFTEASTVLEQVHDEFESFGDAKSAAVANLDLVEIDLHLNQYGSAVLLGSQLSGLFRKLGMRYEEAKINYFTAWAHISMGDFKPAARALKATKALFQREGNKLWLGVVEAAFSKMYLGERRPVLAASKARSAIRLFKLSGDERRRIDAEIALTEAVILSGDFRKGVRLAQRILKGKLVSYQKYETATLAGKGYYTLGEFREALEMFREAVRQVEQMLTGLYPDEVQFFFVLDKLEAYNLMVDCQLRLGEVDSALMTTLTGLRTVNSRKVADALLKKEIPARLLETREQLRAAMNRTFVSPGESGSTRGFESSLSVEEKIWANEKRIRALQYESGRRRIPRPPRLSEIQASLRADEVLLTPIVGPDSLGAFKTTRSGNEYIRYSISRSGLAVLLRKVHFLLERSVFNYRSDKLNDKSVDFYLNRLSEELIEPLHLARSESSLIVMVQDLFAQVPFVALPGLSAPSRTVKLTLTPDSIINRDSRRTDFTRKRNAVFGVSSEVLPQIEAETKEICRRFKSACSFKDGRASVEQLTGELSEADGFVHIAAHASRSSENPLFSRILMSDGPFFPFDLFGSGVRSALITLSGCQTAAPGLYYGNSFSLARAFYLAGSKFVLASLWPVSDKFSRIYMTEFYAALQKDSDIFAAYRHAVSKVRGITDNPAYWGAFILLGI
ncbi:MAG TPA: CHAT domain-containing protein, partial [candidate division Zixibacteria bacterium]|nr:CHAT domain-containing protein [candidate division Zixibacteria bacterium]